MSTRSSLGGKPGSGPVRAAAWVFSSVILAVIVFGVIFSLVAGDSVEALPDSDSTVPGFYVALLPFAVSGLFLALRVPSNAIGWLLMGIAFFWALGAAAANYGLAGLFTDFRPLPGAASVMTLAGGFTWYPAFLCMGLVVFLFPNGRPVSSRWRWAIWAALLGTLATAVAATVNPAPLHSTLGGTNPWGLEGAEGTADVLYAVGSVVSFVLAPVVLASIIIRFRRSTGVEREQIKWLLFAVSVALFAAVIVTTRDLLDLDSLDTVVDVIGVAGLVAAGFLPIAIAIAVVKYRLYELGRIVSRTVMYAVLVTLLGATYAAGVLLLSSLFPADNSSLAVAGATLAVAGLFHPLRIRLLRVVNRVLYRTSYDPEKVIDDVTQVAQASVETDLVVNRLVETVSEALQPERIGVWVKDEGN